VGVAGEHWVEAAARIASELGVPIQAACIGLRQDFDDVDGEWIKIREVSDRGCLLVRPDRFIAWRSHDLAGDPAGALRHAMLSVLGRMPQ
jgi:2,4-dichlorophenol 6-monooxygenase